MFVPAILFALVYFYSSGASHCFDLPCFPQPPFAYSPPLSLSFCLAVFQSATTQTVNSGDGLLIVLL